MNILVIGTGYVGLVAGTCFAEMGHQVTCLDLNKEKIAALKEGKITIYEPGLEELVKRNLQANRLHFTTDYRSAVRSSLICYIAVDTPMSEDGSANLTNVSLVAEGIAEHMDGYRIIVNKSTVPVGTAQFVQNTIQKALEQRGASYEFDIVSNPEFLKEGDAINDFMKPDRVVLGIDSKRAIETMKTLYSSFTLSHERIFIMDTLSAEMTKYASNAMLATRISFMNELSLLCEEVGADIQKVRQGMGADQRIGKHFLYPGVGYGGSCFPKDIQALISMSKAQELDAPLISAVEEVNKNQKQVLFNKVQRFYETKQGLNGKTFAVWGLAFKPNTDDIRESAAINTIQALLEAGANVKAYDPTAIENMKKLLPPSKQLSYCDNEYSAAEDVDAIILVTEWKQFRFADLKRVLNNMKGQDFFDGRNQYIPEEMNHLGFNYFSIGRRSYLVKQEQVKPCSTDRLVHLLEKNIDKKNMIKNY